MRPMLVYALVAVATVALEVQSEARPGGGGRPGGGARPSGGVRPGASPGIRPGFAPGAGGFAPSGGGFYRPGASFSGAVPSARYNGGRYFPGYGGYGPGLYLPYRSGYYGFYYGTPWYAPYSSRYLGAGLYLSLYPGYSMPMYPPQGYPPTGSGIASGAVDEATPPDGSGESGLRITDIIDGGTAKTADLRAGDVILGVGKTRTRTFEELQKALAASKDEVDIVFINGENGKVEKLPVKPVDGKIGVAVVPIQLD
jgi:hypothetical protein